MAFAGRDMTFSERFEALDSPQALFVSKVYTGLTACLALATVSCIAGAHWYTSNPKAALPVISILRFVPCVMLLITWFMRLSGPFGWAFLIAFVAIDGFVLGPLIAELTKTSAGTTSVVLALGLTTTIFVALSAYVRYTGKDFTWMGGMLTIASVAVLVAMIAVMIFGIPANFFLMLSVLSAIIFSGWILYDTSAVTRQYYRDNDVCYAILMLFVDFVGLFVNLLYILNSRDD